MKETNWRNAKTNDRLAAGGYVCRIEDVQDNPDKEYLYIEFDIAEGEYKGYYSQLAASFGFWGGRFYRSYKDKALGMFKGFLLAVEESNDGYKFNNDESTLVGKLVGLILREEEYIGNDGNIKTRLKVSNVKNADAIRDGKFKVPPLKKLPVEETMEDVTDDCPF